MPLVTGSGNMQGVEIPDMVGGYARIQQLKQMQAEAPLRQQALQQQVQIGQQTLQQGQLDIQQKQRALKDQQAMDAAMQQWAQPKPAATGIPAAQGTQAAAGLPAVAGVPTAQATAQAPAQPSYPDYDKLADLVQQNGGSYDTVSKLRQHAIDMRDKATQIAMDAAKTGQDTANTMKTQNTARINALSGVANLSDEQLVPGLQAATQYMTEQGLLDAQHLPIYQQMLQSGDPATIRKQLGMQITSMGGFNQLLDDAQKKIETDQKQRDFSFGPTGPAAEAKYRFILSKQAMGTPLTPDDLNFARGYEASQAKQTTASDTLGVTSTNTSRPAGLSVAGRGGGGMPALPGASAAPTQAGTGTPAPAASPNLSPAQIKGSIVDEIGQYKTDPALFSRMMIKHPEILGMVNAKYPDWDQTNYQAKNKIVQSYTSGPESRSINAIGAALGHANELRDAIDALGNGNTGLNTLRALGQRIGVETGGDATTTFNLIVHRLAPEMTAAYVQGGGGEGERGVAASDFSPSMSRQQLINNWSESVKLLQSKVAQQQQQWNTTYQPSRPQDQFTTRFFSPVANAAIDRWTKETGNTSALGGGGQGSTGNSGGASSGGPAPQTHVFNLGAWKKANPNGDANAARAAALAQKYQVVE